MLIKYAGSRGVVSICCSGRVTYVWHEGNNFTEEVSNPDHAGYILASVQHKFVPVMEAPKDILSEQPKEEPVNEETPQEETEVKEPKKRGRKPKNDKE